MSSTYASALTRLYAYERSSMRLGLETPARLHAALGDPQTAFTAVQLAGTNGKGTAAACLASILRAAGIRTGLFTSPHLVDFSERIRVDGAAIARPSVERLMERVAPAAETLGASYFETVTALAALAFREAEVEVAVAEVGLGGRLDATTVWPSALGGITAIDLDHMDILGEDLAAIAREKAGIARAGGTVLSAETRRPAFPVIDEEAARRGARVLREGREWFAAVHDVGPAGSRIGVRLPDGRAIRDLAVPLAGAHQARNAALAAALAASLEDARVSEDAIREGLARVRWPARADVVEARSKTGRPVRLLLDVAHNPAAAARLADVVRLVAPDAPVVGLVGMLRDKDAPGFAAAVAPVLDAVVASAPETSRAQPAARVADAFEPHTVVESVEPQLDAALERALDLAAARGALLVLTGSCYTVGQCLPRLGVPDLDRI